MFQYIKDEFKVVVIRRYNELSFCWNHLCKKGGNFSSTRNIIKRYEGFEGELEYFASLDSFEALNFKLNVGLGESLLFIATSEHPFINYIKDRARKMGYDYGICEGEQAIYSSIFNEILFGSQIELLSYRSFLNDNLIFPSQNIAEHYVKRTS